MGFGVPVAAAEGGRNAEQGERGRASETHGSNCRSTMRQLFRLLFTVLFLPFRAALWGFRRLYVALWGYSVLRVRVSGKLPDRTGPVSLLGALGRDRPGPALLDLLVALDRARRDGRVEAVFVDMGPLSCGLARSEEVRIALRRLHDAGKRVVVYLEEGGLVEYSAALGATEITIPPSASLNITGIASEVLLFKGLLDRIGVRAWLSARGKYKSMRETFAEPEMSRENREMTESLVGDLHTDLVEAIAAARSLKADEVRAALDRGPFLAEEARNIGLVDQVAFFDDVEEKLKGSLRKFRPLGLGSYMSLSRHLIGRGRPARVALLEVHGHIKSGRSVPGEGGARATGSRRFVEEVGAIAKDPRVRAILLRVDSPGGSALASDVMWHALTKAAEKKPIVVSMSNVAASGGYFVSGIRGAKILALSSTITGSIGVVAGKFDASDLYAKLGIKKEIIAAGKRGGFFSESRGFSSEELQKLETDLDAHYRLFLARMAEGRGKDPEAIHAVAQGRVWTGRQALANGLVDEHGGVLAAFDTVRSALGLAEHAPLAIVSSRSEKRTFPVRLAWRVPENLLPDALLTPLRLAEYFAHERALVLLPFDIRFV
jgi:protease-4